MRARPTGPVLLRPAAEPTGPAAEPARAERNKSGPVGRARMKLPNGTPEGNLF